MYIFNCTFFLSKYNINSFFLYLKAIVEKLHSSLNFATRMHYLSYVTISSSILLRRYKQPKEYPQELPKSPIPPPSVEEYVSTPSPEYLRSTIVLSHDHRDEIRKERAHLSQVFRTCAFYTNHYSY